MSAIGCSRCFVNLLIVAFLIFIISSHYYLKLTPEYSGEEFKRTRIGPISVELPASLKYFRQGAIRLHFQGYSFELIERQSRAECDNLYENRILSNLENLSMGAAEDTSLQYSLSDVYQINKSSYAINIFFGDGCATIQEYKDQDNIFENRARNLRNAADIFLRNYQWLGNDSPSPKGFKTTRGVIKANADFNVESYYTISDWDIFNSSKRSSSSSERSSVLFFDFIPKNHRTLKSVERRTIFERFKSFIGELTGLNFGEQFTYAWIIGERDISFLGSYSQKEYRSIGLNEDRVPNFFYVNMETTGNSSDNCYSDEINVSFLADSMDENYSIKKSQNILYGYWDKIIQSAKCEAY